MGMVATLAALLGAHPAAAFVERGLMTWVSAGLLTLAAGLAFLTHATSLRRGIAPLSRGPGHRIWVVCGLGLLCLAADERWRLHESLGRRVVHLSGSVRWHWLAQRADDLILASIAGLGLIVCLWGRAELGRHAGVVPALRLAAAALALSIAIDLCNHPDLHLLLAGDASGAPAWAAGLEIAEEVPKLLGVTYLALALARALRGARKAAVPAATGPVR